MFYPLRTNPPVLFTILILTTGSCGGSTDRPYSTGPSDAVSWFELPTDSGVVRVAIARPEGNGPFPATIILHGTHGFAEEYVQLARDLARNGILSFAVCWFDGGTGAGRRFVTPIACKGAPPFVDAPGMDRFRLSRNTIDVLISSLRTRPDVRNGKLVLLGHSRGAGAALDYALARPTYVSGLILNSAGYPDEVIARAAALSPPVLLLHGKADNPGDGGSAMTDPARARRFEDALRRSARVVESQYYPGGHNSLFADTAQYRDTVRRIAYFVNRAAAN
ncbi:MAG TPA: alpha/beta hydrolase [Longimicrobiales bacterium]